MPTTNQTPVRVLSLSAAAGDSSSGLGTKQLTDATSASGGSIVLLNNMAHSVANQPKFPKLDVKGLENVNDHLATAQTHANQWLNTYSGEVMNTLQGVITFGELYGNLYKSLYSAAQQLGTQSGFNPGQIAALISEIQALQGQVQTQTTKAQAVYTDIAAYNTAVAADYSQFMTDYNTAQAQLGGDTGAIKALQDKIDSENSALTKDALMIAGGAVGMVAGVLCIVAGALGEFETAGASTALIVGGIALLAGGATVTGIGGKNYDDTLGELRTDTIALGNMQNELKGLKSLSSGLTNLTTAIKTTESALQTLVTSWQQLDNSMAAVVSDLQAPETYLENLKKDDPTATPATVSIIVSAELQTANDDWASALTNAKTMLANLRGVQLLTATDASGNLVLPTQQAILDTYNRQAA